MPLPAARNCSGRQCGYFFAQNRSDNVSRKPITPEPILISYLLN
jgi:hypothetical protein